MKQQSRYKFVCRWKQTNHSIFGAIVLGTFVLEQHDERAHDHVGRDVLFEPDSADECENLLFASGYAFEDFHRDAIMARGFSDGHCRQANFELLVGRDDLQIILNLTTYWVHVKGHSGDGVMIAQMN